MRWRNHSHCATANSHHCHGHRRRRHHRRRRRRCLCGHRHRLLLRAMKKTWTWTIHLCRHHQYQLYRRFLRHPPSPSQSWWNAYSIRLKHHRRLFGGAVIAMAVLLALLLAGLATSRWLVLPPDAADSGSFVARGAPESATTAHQAPTAARTRTRGGGGRGRGRALKRDEKMPLPPLLRVLKLTTHSESREAVRVQ